MQSLELTHVVQSSFQQPNQKFPPERAWAEKQDCSEFGSGAGKGPRKPKAIGCRGALRSCAAFRGASFSTTVVFHFFVFKLWLFQFKTGIAVPNSQYDLVNELGYDQGKLHEIFENSFYPFFEIKGAEFETNLSHENYDSGLFLDYLYRDNFLRGSVAPTSPNYEGPSSSFALAWENFLLYHHDLIQWIFGDFTPASKMTSSGQAPHTGVSLHEFRRDIPPGWAPRTARLPAEAFL